MRIRALLLITLLSCACDDSAPAPAATPQAAGPVAVVTLSAGQRGDAAGHATVDVTVPASAAQARLDLPGISQPADELTAELEALASGEVRRWPVDATASGVSVTVPGYAVAAGEHVLTLWQGDADVVARYSFRISVP